MKSFFFHFLALIFPPHPFVLKIFVFFKWQFLAAFLVNSRHDELALFTERIVSNDMFKKRWQFFKAGVSLLECKPTVVAAIFAQWMENSFFKKDDFRAHFKPAVILGIWLTAPFIMNDDKKRKTVLKVIEIFSLSKPPLMERIFKDIKGDALVQIFKCTREMKAMALFTTLEYMSDASIAHLLCRLKELDKGQADFIFNRFKIEKAERVHALMRHEEIEMNRVRIGNFWAEMIEKLEPHIDRKLKQIEERQNREENSRSKEKETSH